MQPLAQFPYLQWLSLVLNRITDLHGLIGPALECVNLNGWLNPSFPGMINVSLMLYVSQKTNKQKIHILMS